MGPISCCRAAMPLVAAVVRCTVMADEGRGCREPRVLERSWMLVLAVPLMRAWSPPPAPVCLLPSAFPTPPPPPLPPPLQIDELDSLMPCMDLRVANVFGEEAPQLFALCGRGPRSSLRILRPGLAVTEMAVTQLPGGGKRGGGRRLSEGVGVEDRGTCMCGCHACLCGEQRHESRQD